MWRTKATNYRPPALRWAGVKESASKSLDKIIDKEESFNFRPKLILLRGFIRPSCLRKKAEKSALHLGRLFP